MDSMNQHLAKVLDSHFDPKWGTPYWLERVSNLGFDPRTDIRNVEDLARFGHMPLELLAQRKIRDFIPRKYHHALRTFISSETGGTTGPPKRTAFLPEEFEMAFVSPFLQAAQMADFPRDVDWLYIGPSGPHIVGKAARACATALGSIDPFFVDFDPKWVRSLVPGSLARKRYVEHVLRQAENVLHTQEIGVIFSTPPILASLGTRLEQSLRESIAGIHLGGMAADNDFWEHLTSQWFPNAKALAGYGNSLAGMCPQLSLNLEGLPEYFSYGHRLILEVHNKQDTGRGTLCFHRLDESCFLPNVIERDEVESIGTPPYIKAKGFQPFGISNPRPPEKNSKQMQQGLY